MKIVRFLKFKLHWNIAVKLTMFDRLLPLVTLGAMLGAMLPLLSLAAPHETMIARGDWRAARRAPAAWRPAGLYAVGAAAQVRLLGLWSYVGESGSPRAAPLLVLPRESTSPTKSIRIPLNFRSTIGIDCE